MWLNNRPEFTPHLCSSIDATALKLPRPHSTYSASLTPQHLCCSSQAASFLPQHSRSRLHGTASMLPLSHPCIHAAALMLQHSRHSILSPLSRRHIEAVALTKLFMQQNSRLCMNAAIFIMMPPHARSRIHAALTQQH